MDCLSRADSPEKLQALQQWAQKQMDDNPHAIAPSAKKFVRQHLDRVEMELETIEVDSTSEMEF